LLDRGATRPVTLPAALPFCVVESGGGWDASTLHEAGAGDTGAAGAGTRVTVIAEVPVFPSQVAVMVAEPAATPLTSPLPFTVAAAVLSLDQVTTRPESVPPLAFFGVAVRLTEPAMAIVAELGLTATEATGVGPAGLVLSLVF